MVRAAGLGYYGHAGVWIPMCQKSDPVVMGRGDGSHPAYQYPDMPNTLDTNLAINRHHADTAGYDKYADAN